MRSVPDVAPSGWGMAHGRFQPFHNGHLEYVVEAAARCDRLLVGITNPDPARSRFEPADRERHRADANPFSYTDRLLMIDAAMRSAGLRDRVHIVPFPVSEPELWSAYVPPGTTHFVRVFDAWGRAKVDRLSGAGERVVVLDPGATKTVSGSDVRRALEQGGPWEHLVPAAVVSIISNLVGDRAIDLHLPA